MTSEVAKWLSNHLAGLGLGEAVEGYLYGRGATESLLAQLGIREWSTAKEPSPSPHFAQRYGARGEKLVGMIVIPIWSPLRELIGIEVRTPSRNAAEKKISEFRLPEAAWNPFLIGTPEAAEKLWVGGSVWVCEGVYDLFALARVLPPNDCVVATLKAGLSRDHVRFFSRFCVGRVHMVYDNDETGRRATNGCIDKNTGKYRPGALDLLRKAKVPAVDYHYRGKDPGAVWDSGGVRNLRAVFQLEGA